MGREQEALEDLQTYLRLKPDAEDYDEVMAQIAAYR